MMEQRVIIYCARLFYGARPARESWSAFRFFVANSVFDSLRPRGKNANHTRLEERERERKTDRDGKLSVRGRGIALDRLEIFR